LDVSGPETSCVWRLRTSPDGILHRTAVLPSEQQASLSGFGSVGLQGSQAVDFFQQPPRPSVLMGMGVREEVAAPSQGRSQVRFPEGGYNWAS